MIKSLLTTAAVVLTSIPAFAGSPAIALSAVSTVYGKFGCVQRAQNKLFALGGTSINTSSNFVWGTVNGETTVGVWCRGSEAIITVSGDNASNVRDEIKTAF